MPEFDQHSMTQMESGTKGCQELDNCETLDLRFENLLAGFQLCHRSAQLLLCGAFFFQLMHQVTLQQNTRLLPHTAIYDLTSSLFQICICSLIAVIKHPLIFDSCSYTWPVYFQYAFTYVLFVLISLIYYDISYRPMAPVYFHFSFHEIMEPNNVQTLHRNCFPSVSFSYTFC